MKRSHFLQLMLAATLSAAAGLSGTALAQTVEVEGVKFEPTIQLGGATLQLNGVGVRTRAIFRVYVAGLYVPQKEKTAPALLAQTGPRRVAMAMLRNVDAESFSSALNDGLRANLTEAQVAGFKAQIEALNASLKAVGEVKRGDLINFEFTPEAGTRITLNGQPRGAAIPGEDFFAAVLRIWIGDKPVDAALKRGLIGG
jgi:hypothetical protein